MPQQQPSPVEPGVTERMQRDWNARAVEDAHFYVAFGRREQDPEEFFATAAETVKGLEWEMRRLPAGNPRARRALEIGCGPGRLLRPMSRHFGEIHGIDVSDEMIRRASANLRDVPHAHTHHTSGADLSPFADESFDFIYSYAVFQHIPSRAVVMQYLNEANRVLKPGGILRCQINGLDASAPVYDTWSGVRISAGEVRDFARQHKLQLLALEGARTQYMWTTLRKPAAADADAGVEGPSRIRRITNAHSSEPVAPPSGRYASITAWIENLPPQVDLNSLSALVGGAEGVPCYIGPREHDGLQQLNVMLPELPRTGLLPFEVLWQDRPLAGPVPFRIVPPGPQVPILIGVTDGINLLSGTRIVTGTLKVTVEETVNPESFSAAVSGKPVREIDIFCADPLPPRWEINCHLPEDTLPGPHELELRLGRRLLARVQIEVARPV